MAQRFVTEFVIDGDASGGVRAFNDTQRSADQLNRSMETGTQRTAEYTRGIGSASQELQVLRRVAAPVTALVAGMFTANTLKGQVDFADQVQKINLRIGASTEFLSEMNYVAEMSGVKFSELATALQRQTRRMSEAANGGGPMVKTLEALNLNATELVQLAPEQQFDRIAQALGGVANESDRVAMAQKIWDSEGVKLLQIVNQGTNAIQMQREQARALGLTISTETANAMAGFNDEMARVNFAAQGLAQTLLAEIVPGMTSTMQATNELIQDLGGAETVIANLKDGTLLFSGIMAGRLVGSLAATTAGTYKRIAADRQSIQAEIAATQAAVRRTAAEKQSAMAFLSTARLEEQATRGTAAHALALDNLSRARAQAATAAGAHTSATAASTAAMGRSTAAAGALRGAYALIGGPVGAAVMAGAAAYYFRDSLGFTSAAAREAKQEIDQLVGSMDDYTEAQYRNNRVSIVQDLAEARVEAEKLSRQILELQDQSREEGILYQGRGGAATSQLQGLRAELQEQQRIVRANEEGLRQYDRAWQDVLEGQVSGVSIFRTLDQWLMKSGDSLRTFNASLGESGDKWDDYIGKLTSARDVLGMTAAEAAAYAAQQEGYSGLYSEQAAAVAGQTDALNSYRQAVASGNEAEATAHLERAQRYAEAEAMVKAQLENIATLTGLLQGVQTELSATALSAALVVGDGAGAASANIANAIKAINERAAAIRQTTTVTVKNTAASRDADKAAQEAKRAADQLVKSYDSQVASLKEEIALFGETGDAAKLRYEIEHGKLKDLAPDQKTHLLQLREELDLKEKQAKATADFKKRTDDLVSTYDRQAQQAKKLKADIEAVNAAYADPAVEMSAEQHARMLAEINHQQYMLALESETTFAAMATAWENSVKRMDDAGVQFWRGFLDGTGNAMDQFKRLVTDSVAEVAHALITRPLVIGLQTQIADGMGLGPGGMGAGGGLNFGGMGSLRNGWQALQNGFSGVQWGGVSTGYSGGFAGSATAGMNTATQGTSYLGGSMRNFGGMQGVASMGTGYAGGRVGTELGGAIFGKEAGSAYAATAGAAIGTYFGGPLGAFAGGTIGGALDSLFGSSKSDPRLNISTYGTRESFNHDSVAESRLGVVGFGKGTRRSDELFGSIEKEREFLKIVAGLDDVMAGLAPTPAVLEKMQRALQGVHLSAGDVSSISDMLVQRTAAVARVIDGDFVDSLMASGLTAEQMTERMVSATSAMQVLSSASGRLNLQFDATAANAMQQADTIAQLMGGPDQLASAQSQYYDAFYTEQEKFDRLAQDLGQTFGALGMHLPDTREGVRELVEGLQLADAAGQRQLAAVYQNVGGLNQYIDTLQQQRDAANDATGALEGINDSLRTAADIARERSGIEREWLQLTGNTGELRRLELMTLDPSNRALKARNHALQDEQAAQEAATRAQQERNRAIQQEAQAQAQAINRLMSGVQGAYQSLTSSIQAEQQVLRNAYDATTASINANIDRVRDGMNATERTARGLTTTLDKMIEREMGLESSRRDAQSYLQQVLASGGLGDAERLDKALGVIAEPSEGLFASFEDYQRDFWKTANLIDELNDRADGQLTTEQRSLSALERQLTSAEQQHDRAMGRLDSVLAAESAQLEAMFGQQDWLQTINGSVLSLGDALAGLRAAQNTAAPRSNATVKEAAGYISSQTAGGWDEKDAAIGWAAIENGVTSAQLAASLGKSQQYVLDRAQTLGLPKFRDGGIATGPMSGYPVELHGTEAVIPLQNGPVPLRIEQSNQHNPLLEELRRVTQRLESVERQLEEANSINVGIAEHNAKLASETERMRRKAEQESA
ncbi:hypothetical protein [Vreelandella sp. EE22]